MADAQQAFGLPDESGVLRAGSDHMMPSSDSTLTHPNHTHTHAYAPTAAPVPGVGSAPPNPSSPDARRAAEIPDDAPLDKNWYFYFLGQKIIS